MATALARFNVGYNRGFHSNSNNNKSQKALASAAILIRTAPGVASNSITGAAALGVAVSVVVGELVESAGELAGELAKASSESQENETQGNSNPYDGPVDGNVNVVDPEGNVIPVKAGEQVTGSEDGTWIQVRDVQGNPTGTRKDGGHPKNDDPKAKEPHGHRVDENGNKITDETGNPHLKIKY